MSSGGESDLLVADLGTGSGAIALSIAQEVPQAQVCATDISEEVALLSEIEPWGWDLTLPEFLCVTVIGLGARRTWEIRLLISNPPYISPDDDLPKVVKDWEPQAALIGGEDGFPTWIFDSARQKLIRPGAGLSLSAVQQAERLRDLAISAATKQRR